MKSYYSVTIAVAATLLPALSKAVESSTSEDPQQPTSSPASGLGLKATQQLGCFSSPGDMWDMGAYVYQSPGWCQPLCVRQSAPYFALVNGTNCFCGKSKPKTSLKLPNTKCNSPCNGYGDSTCGGPNLWAIYADGFVDGDKTGSVSITQPTQTWFGHDATHAVKSSSKAHITKVPETIPKAGATVIVTVSGHAQPSVVPSGFSASSSGVNKGAVAGGVVVGVLVLAGIIGTIILVMKRKKAQAVEDERRRHDAITNFVTRGAEKPSSTFSASDSRLEPSVMFQRRQSDGSIADNQDYSRRILKVTNPDDR